MGICRDLTGTQLQGASLPRAELRGASLDNAKLQGASLVGAQLQGAVPSQPRYCARGVTRFSQLAAAYAPSS